MIANIPFIRVRNIYNAVVSRCLYRLIVRVKTWKHKICTVYRIRQRRISRTVKYSVIPASGVIFWPHEVIFIISFYNKRSFSIVIRCNLLKRIPINAYHIVIKPCSIHLLIAPIDIWLAVIIRKYVRVNHLTTGGVSVIRWNQRLCRCNERTCRRICNCYSKLLCICGFAVCAEIEVIFPIFPLSDSRCPAVFAARPWNICKVKYNSLILPMYKVFWRETLEICAVPVCSAIGCRINIICITEYDYVRICIKSV